MELNKEFVPYQPSFDMKKLGFDEPCFGWHADETHFSARQQNYQPNDPNNVYNWCLAPLYQQAFRWFREKYGLIGFISFNKKSTFRIETLPHSNIKLNSYKEKYFDNNGKLWNTYEEAELECLKKLIEIVKNGIKI